MRALLFVALLTGSTAPVELRELGGKIKPAVVHLMINGDQGKATGFLISADGRVVTNHHVVEHASTMTAVFSDGKEHEVLGVLAQSKERDLAIIQLAGQFSSYLELGETQGLEEGTSVALVGSPVGLAFSVLPGTVSGLHAEGEAEKLLKTELVDCLKGRWLQLDVGAEGGSSGSPVVTYDGKVIGVEAAGLTGTAINCAVPVEYLKELLATVTPQTQPQSLRATAWRNALISVGLLGAIGLWLLIGRLRERAARRGSRGGSRVVNYPH